MEEEYSDMFQNRIKLTDKHWNHITKEHPEIEPYKNKISDVLSKPDLIKRSKRVKVHFYTTDTAMIYMKANIC